jgi:hypothetical protein
MREHHTTKGIAGIGGFLAGAMTVAAIGGYFLFGSRKARRNRQKLEGWIEDAKEEVISKAKRVKGLTQEKFDDVVDTVLDKYARLKHATHEKIEDLREDLSDRWEEIKEEVEDED